LGNWTKKRNTLLFWFFSNYANRKGISYPNLHIIPQTKNPATWRGYL